MGALGALFAVGTAVSAYSSYSQGVAAQQAADYNAAILRNNALTAEYQAQDAARRGEFEKGQKRREIAQNIGKARVAYAAQGVKLGSGSPLEVEANIAALGEEDLAMIDYNSALEQWGFRSQAQDIRNQANLTALQGKMAKRAGNVGALSSLIGGATQYYSLKFQRGE